MAITKIPAAGFTGNNFRNIIINGDMSIDQRNAGASVTANDNVFSVDRWKTFATQSSKLTAQQNAGAITPPAGFNNYLGYTSSSAYSITSTDYFIPNQGIEGYNVVNLDFGTSNAKSITLSFWVRSSLTGTFGGTIRNGAANRNYPFTYTINTSNTWEKKSITIPGDTSGTWLKTNGYGLGVQFGLGVGATYSGTAGVWSSNLYFSATGATSLVGTSGATWYITGVQLEAASAPSDFEFLPFDVNLQRCERYYQKSFAYATAPADNLQKYEYHFIEPYSGGSMAGIISYYKTEMRTIPTVTVYTTGQSANGTGKISFYNGSSWNNASVTVSAGSTEKFFLLDGGSFTNMKLAQFNYEATAEL